MNLEKRINAFVKLGEILREVRTKNQESGFESIIEKATRHNAWFTQENILLAIGSLGEMLEESKLRKWIGNYSISQESGVGSWERKTSTLLTPNSSLRTRVGVIMAGNIPLVGFHDFLCVLMSGNIFVGKLSSDDEFLLPAVAEILCEIEPEFKTQISPSLISPKGRSLHAQTPSLREGWGGLPISAFIATGSNNSARYFEYYFGKYPHIIRKNRNAIAVLDGTETENDLKNLGKDIFQYFGLGCRNVSKIFIPQDYILDRFFEAVVDFGDVIHHNKYANNYSYYRTIYLLNTEKFLDNNFLLLKESNEIASPVATLFYERYKNKEELFQKLEERKSTIQCVVSGLTTHYSLLTTIPFGQTQSPELWDYADGVDTMKFLRSL
ncbi:MAG: acyl-CoA reductase [Bacteroidetes bacterium]|nr:acyl-CoA reductase [Bacteroidota bacterium]